MPDADDPPDVAAEPAGAVAYERDETAAHRLDRNFAELLQELRVAQTGVQILFAFLLAIAFQPRFAVIADWQRAVYVATLICAAVAAIALIAPAAAHRALFGRHRKDELVRYTGHLAAVGLAFLAVAILGAVLLVISVVIRPWVAALIVCVLALLVLTTWLLGPLRERRRPDL